MHELQAHSDVSPLSAVGTILVVASNSHTGGSLSEILRGAGHKVDVTAWAAGIDVPVAAMQLAILICSKPNGQAENICSAIRRAAPKLPLIGLGPDDVGIKVKLFDLGADDYLVDPFEGRELLARIRCLIRRRGQ
jgi:DNA-binding response OmpR family regulator